ncbi:hypothetical protein LF95_16500 [Thalassospira sp. TSL5-1]|nr:hypothetical protein LF95_16500 [Thalassospira sp. TSL5-1]
MHDLRQWPVRSSNAPAIVFCLTHRGVGRKQRALFLRPILRIVVPNFGTARFVMRGFHQKVLKT